MAFTARVLRLLGQEEASQPLREAIQLLKSNGKVSYPISNIKLLFLDYCTHNYSASE